VILPRGSFFKLSRLNYLQLRHWKKEPYPCSPPQYLARSPETYLYRPSRSYGLLFASSKGLAMPEQPTISALRVALLPWKGPTQGIQPTLCPHEPSTSIRLRTHVGITWLRASAGGSAAKQRTRSGLKGAAGIRKRRIKIADLQRDSCPAVVCSQKWLRPNAWAV
jgi:hypothetical protein